MKNVVVIFFLSLLLTLGYWFLKGFEDEEGAEGGETSDKDVFVAYEVRAKYFGSEGKLLYQLISQQVNERSKKQGTRFTTPVVKAFQDYQLEWQGSSETAFMTADKETIKLLNDVHIIQSPMGEQIDLTGDELEYDANTSTIFSNQPVTITDGLINQVSNHFSLNIKTDKIKFNEGVKATYQDENNKQTKPQ